jgi:hypothetical protein
MQSRYLTVVTLALGLAALSLGRPVAAQKGKPPADVLGTFTMRTAGPPHVDGPDRLTGDNLGAYEADADGTSVILNGNREFRTGLFGARFVYLDFSQVIEAATCGAGCFRTFGDIVIPEANTYPPEGPYRVSMQTNVVDINNVEIPNGLMGLVEGNSSPARFFVTFKDPAGRDFHWSALFNPGEYPGSTLVQVTRIGPCTWTIEANGAGAVGGLRAWSVRKGKNGNSDEGLFSMPFGITFTLPNCGA